MESIPAMAAIVGDKTARTIPQIITSLKAPALQSIYKFYSVNPT